MLQPTTLDISGENYPIRFDVEIFHEFNLNEDRTELFYDDIDSVIKSHVIATVETDDGAFRTTATSNGASPSESWTQEPDDIDCYSELNLNLQGAAQDRLIDAILTAIPQKARDFGEKYDWNDEEIEALIQSTELFRDPNNSQRIDTAVHFNPQNSNVVEMENLKFIFLEKVPDKVFCAMSIFEEKIKESQSLPEGQQKAFNRKLNEKIRATAGIPESIPKKESSQEQKKEHIRETNSHGGR